MINHQISADGFWERPILAPLMRAFPLAMQALKVTNGKQAFPVQVKSALYVYFKSMPSPKYYFC